MTVKYLNKDYKANIIHLGGQGIQVNDGVIELSAEDNEKWGSQMKSFGFQLEKEKSEPVKSSGTPASKVAEIGKD